MGSQKSSSSIGREFCAWKTIDRIDGAESSAIIYSVVENAKANDLNPLRHLEHVLTILKDHKDDMDYSFIEELLPWSVTVYLISIGISKNVEKNKKIRFVLEGNSIFRRHNFYA